MILEFVHISHIGIDIHFEKVKVNTILWAKVINVESQIIYFCEQILV
jgi:hypothetical protein